MSPHKTSERLPEEGQRVWAYVHQVVQYTDGHGDSQKEDKGISVMLSWFTHNPYPVECGCFVDGFAFGDDEIYAREVRVPFWYPAEYPPIPEVK